MLKVVSIAALAVVSVAANAQSTSQEPPMNAAAPLQSTQTAPPLAPVAAAPVVRAARVLPANTLMMVTPLQEISSKHIEEGDQVQFATVNDVVENGAVAIPRGSPVRGTISWKTGRAIGGKSGKFEVTFNAVSLGGRDYALRGTHRQEGRGNTVGALLGSIVISGRSAVMIPGQMVNIFTVEPISY